MNIAKMKFSASFLLLPNLFNLRCLSFPLYKYLRAVKYAIPGDNLIPRAQPYPPPISNHRHLQQNHLRLPVCFLIIHLPLSTELAYRNVSQAEETKDMIS